MSIFINSEIDNDIDESFEQIITDVAQGTLDYLGVKYDYELSVTFTDNHGIQEINLSERGIDSPTDVLSFPLLDFEKPGDLSYVERYPQDYFNPENKELILGDIVISMEKMEEQAKEYGHSVKRELAFLVVHSMLHLMGYDHMEESDRIEMEKLQDDILNMKGYTRDYE